MSVLVKANISETIQTKLSVSNELEITDQALVEATADAKARAERLAKSQGKRLGDPYSISEFMTRGEERFTLFVNRRVEGQSTQAVANLALASSGGYEPFEPGLMVARAQVYVVYLLK
jgi:uncharacterized protein YggE